MLVEHKSAKNDRFDASYGVFFLNMHNKMLLFIRCF